MAVGRPWRRRVPTKWWTPEGKENATDPVDVLVDGTIHINLGFEASDFFYPSEEAANLLKVRCPPIPYHHLGRYRRIQYHPYDHPVLLRPCLHHVVTFCLKAVWEWHVPEKSQVVTESVFNWAAYSIRRFWNFIFTVGTQFGFTSWAIHSFFWGIGNVQEAKMERIASEFTNAFRRPLTMEKAASWVQEIIARTLWIFTRMRDYV
jgi:hypothetical protein